MSITIIDRFRPRQRAAWQAAADAGRLRVIDELALLEPAQIRPLALFSLLLLILGGVFFVVLNLVAFTWRTGQTGATYHIGQIVLWLVLNIVSYILILPVHELLHGLTFQLWGGKPYYGTKLPFALYCSTKNQLFPRNYYLAVGLAPVVVITLAGIIFTLLAPTLSPYVLLATAGNVSGAAGDLWMVRRLLTVPSMTFVEDQETGYRVWQEMTTSAESATIAADEHEKEC